MLMKKYFHITVTLLVSAYLLIIFVPNIDNVVDKYGRYSIKFFSVAFTIGVVLLNLLFLIFDTITMLRSKKATN
jgi:hypothetical protein